MQQQHTDTLAQWHLPVNKPHVAAGHGMSCSLPPSMLMAYVPHELLPVPCSREQTRWVSQDK